MSDTSILDYNLHQERVNTELIRQEVAREHLRPCVVWRPTLTPDGDKWCALLGDNLQVGIAGFGDTPALAMADFDAQWANARAGVRA